MQSYLRASLLLFAAAIGVAYAAPARPLYVPPEPPKMPVHVLADLNGTAWIGKYLTVQRLFVFEADGTVSYQSANIKAGKLLKNRGFWKLQGKQLYFDHHMGSKKNVMEFRGTITDANTIVGEATYLNTGAKEKQALQRTVSGPK